MEVLLILINEFLPIIALLKIIHQSGEISSAKE